MAATRPDDYARVRETAVRTIWSVRRHAGVRFGNLAVRSQQVTLAAGSAVSKRMHARNVTLEKRVASLEARLEQIETDRDG